MRAAEYECSVCIVRWLAYNSNGVSFGNSGSFRERVMVILKVAHATFWYENT